MGSALGEQHREPRRPREQREQHRSGAPRPLEHGFERRRHGAVDVRAQPLARIARPPLCGEPCADLLDRRRRLSL
jgi:hypothetical protein